MRTYIALCVMLFCGCATATDPATQILTYKEYAKIKHGADYIVKDADFETAEIHCNPLLELDILKRGVSSPKFTMEEYKDIYTSIMKQRAKSCGLDIEISFDEINCVIKLKRVSESSK